MFYFSCATCFHKGSSLWERYKFRLNTLHTHTQIQNKHIQTRVGFFMQNDEAFVWILSISNESSVWVLVLVLDSAVFMHAHIRRSHHLQPVCNSRKRGCSLRTFGSKQTTINKWIVICFRFCKSEILHRFVRREIKPETVLITCICGTVFLYDSIVLFYYSE